MGLQLPPWLEEYAGWLAALFIIVAFLIPVQMLGVFDRPPASKPVTVLRVFGIPSKKWFEGSSTRIESLAVDIENVGPEVARKVSVEGVVRGSAFLLAGPQEIQPGQRARYSGKTSLNVMSEDALTFRLSCDNCAPSQ